MQTTATIRSTGHIDNRHTPTLTEQRVVSSFKNKTFAGQSPTSTLNITELDVRPSAPIRYSLQPTTPSLRAPSLRAHTLASGLQVNLTDVDNRPSAPIIDFLQPTTPRLRAPSLRAHIIATGLPLSVVLPVVSIFATLQPLSNSALYPRAYQQPAPVRHNLRHSASNTLPRRSSHPIIPSPNSPTLLAHLTTSLRRCRRRQRQD